MAALATTPIQLTGTVQTLAAAGSGGDTVAPGDNTFLAVNNASGASMNVTVVTPGEDQFGSAAADLVIAVGAGATKFIGPLAHTLAAVSGAAAGRVPITYSLATSVTVAAFSA